MTNPAEDFATFIAANVPGLVLGQNLYYGQPKAGPNIPDDAVFVRSGPGPSPTRVMSGRYEVREPMVHVRARARTDSVASDWVEAIQDLVQTQMPTGYMDAQAMQSGAMPVGETESALILYTITFKLTYERDAQNP